MPPRSRLCALALVTSFAAAAGSARPARADETSPANVAAARRHYEKARADYAQGAYREAIGELEAAHSLDPNAKDLVFNLGVVHEKLADIDDALKWFHMYTSMSLTPAERDRADAYIRRLEGAKKEVDEKAAQEAASAPPPAPAPAAPPPVPETPPRGRIDGWTIGAAGVAVAGLGLGTAMAIKAEVDRPPAGYVTGRTGSYDDLVNRVNRSHSEAVVADVGFGVAAAGAIATAILYFTRPKAAVATGSASVSFAPMTGGGALFVQGSL